MSRFARTILILLAVLFVLPAAALADGIDPLGFRFAASTFSAHEHDGAATITVTRANTLLAAQVRYVTTHGTALPGSDYTTEKGVLDFAAGQGSATFAVPVVDHGIAGVARTVNLSLFGSTIDLGSPSTAVLTILQDDVNLITRNPGNPLALAASPPSNDPLTGAQPFVDRQYAPAAVEARKLSRHQPRTAGLISVIARQPTVHRFGNWTPDPKNDVARFLARAAHQSPRTVPEISTYYLVDRSVSHGKCGGVSDPSSRPAKYDRWINRFAQGIGQYQTIVFLEMDSIITSGCLSSHGVQVRMAELKDAMSVLSKLPRTVVYVDAGAADALPATRVARLLNMAGISQIQGFFLNSTHYDWTSHEINYGEQISRLTGGKHFVVNTAVNGRGPLVPASRVKSGNEVLCNPPGRGLGPLPSFATGYPDVDAFAWIGQPGNSGGTCNGGPSTGTFWPALAASLVKHADFRVR
jgi:endoglucanase